MANYTKVVTKTVDEWLAIRQPRLGGSEISAVIGVNPFCSRYDLYLRKRGEVEPIPENMAMRLGHKLENAVAELLAEEAGYQIIKNTAGNLIYLSKDIDFAEASPDRIGYLPGERKTEANKIIIEIKTTQKTIDEEALPEYWLCQVQWYMGITGIHRAVIAWLSSGRDFGYKEIPFSEEFFKFLVEEGRSFMQDVQAGNEPEPYTARDVAMRYPKHIEGKTTECTEDVALACGEYKEVKAQIKALEEKAKTLEETIKLAFADAEMLTYSDVPVATYKAVKDRTSFDSAKCLEEHPEFAEIYKKTVAGSRRLIIK